MLGKCPDSMLIYSNPTDPLTSFLHCHRLSSALQLLLFPLPASLPSHLFIHFSHTFASQQHPTSASTSSCDLPPPHFILQHSEGDSERQGGRCLLWRWPEEARPLLADAASLVDQSCRVERGRKKDGAAEVVRAAAIGQLGRWHCWLVGEIGGC